MEYSYSATLQTWRCGFRPLQSSKYYNKVSQMIFFGFPVYIKVMFTLYCSLLCATALFLKKKKKSRCTFIKKYFSADFPGGLMAKTLPNAGGLGLIPGQGSRCHMPQQKILHATVKTKDPTCCN